jgi:hypothetical protein
VMAEGVVQTRRTAFKERAAAVTAVCLGCSASHAMLEPNALTVMVRGVPRHSRSFPLTSAWNFKFAGSEVVLFCGSRWVGGWVV